MRAKYWVTAISTPVSLEFPSTLSAFRMSSVLYTFNVWSHAAKVKPNLLEMVSKLDRSRGKSFAGSKTLTFFIWRNWKSWNTWLIRVMCLTLARTNNPRNRTCHVVVSHLEITYSILSATYKMLLLYSLTNCFANKSNLHKTWVNIRFRRPWQFRTCCSFQWEANMLTWVANYRLWKQHLYRTRLSAKGVHWDLFTPTRTF